MPGGSTPPVLSWEQLSHYSGFKVVGVEAGVNASICLFVSHTQEVFAPAAGWDLPPQVRKCGCGLGLVLWREGTRVCESVGEGCARSKGRPSIGHMIEMGVGVEP